MNENCVVCQKKITSQLRRHPTIDGDDRSGKPCCRGCHDKAHAEKMNENCVVCQKKITSDIRFYPTTEGDDRSGKPCCRGCHDKARAEKMNENCVVCQKKITSRIHFHPEIDGDDRSGKPCCYGCIAKAIEKKNLELDNICERCNALRKKKVGGRYARKCEISSEVYWRCKECHRRLLSKINRDEKRRREGKPPPRKYTRRKFC